MTDDELKDIQLDHEAVYHAQGWDLEEGRHTRMGDGSVLIKLPDDPQKCVDAVPKLLAELKRRDAALDTLRATLAGEHGDALAMSPSPQMPSTRARALAWVLRLLDAARGVGHV